MLKRGSKTVSSHGIRHLGNSPRLQHHYRSRTHLLAFTRQSFGEIEITISAVTVAELVHGVVRANTLDIRQRRRAFIDELKKHVPVHPVTDETGEIAGKISGERAAVGIKVPIDDLLIGASAIEQGCAVATLNVRHFEEIPGLRVTKS